MNSQPEITEFYTDGGCINNPGSGGWGVVTYFHNGSILEIGQHEPETTNNRMEMIAALMALQIFHLSGQTKPATLYTDSEYVKKGITQWVQGWKQKGWKTAKGKPVLNQDLWEKLDHYNSPLIQWQYVKGHSGNEGNDRADRIANDFAQGLIPSLQQDLSDFNLQFQDQISQMSVVGDFRSKIRLENTYSSPSQLHLFSKKSTMSESSTPETETLQPFKADRVQQLNQLIETLRIADEIAEKGYLISSSELADLMDINASAVTSRGDHWSWRNWIVSRVRREGNQILWQLEKADA